MPANVDFSAFLAHFEPRRPPPLVEPEECPILLAIKAFLSEKKRTIAQWLRVYDRERTGELPTDILAIALRRAGFYPSATPEEIELIQRLFPGRSPATVKWELFAAAVDPVQENASEPKDTEPPPPEPRAIPPEIASLLSIVRDACKRENVNLGDEFRRRDRNHAGILLTSTFLPAMRVVLPRVPSTKLEPLTEFYGQKEFRYIEFLRDLADASSAPSATSAPVREAPEAAGALTLLLKRIKAHLTASMTDPADLFRAVDPGRAGYCRKDRTLGCLNLSRMKISESDLAVLFNAYPVDGYPERFNYRELCNALKTVRMDRETAAWEINPELETEKHEVECHMALHAIREKLNAKRTSIWSYFKNCREDRISEREFRQKIGFLNLEIPEGHVNTFVKRYGNREGIAWKSFCADVERRVFV
jgi:hypothetical protein